MIGVLHTWARDLSYHPHVHYPVPGGGFDEAEESWLPGREGFFLAVKPLSLLFRAIFRDGLRNTDLFDGVPQEVRSRDWVVHCQPVGSGAAALKYLAPYIFRVAISNGRLCSLAGDKVTFSYRESDSGTLRFRTLSAEEFIRRFLHHVLPKGFVKVRYYGFVSSGNRHRLALIRRLLGMLKLAAFSTKRKNEILRS